MPKTNNKKNNKNTNKKKINKPKVEKEVVVVKENEEIKNETKDVEETVKENKVANTEEKKEEKKVKKKNIKSPKKETINQEKQEEKENKEVEKKEVIQEKNKKATKKKTTKKVEEQNLEKIIDKENDNLQKEKEENSVNKENEELKEESNKNLIKVPKKEVLKQDEKPEYVQEMIRKRKRKKIIIISIILIILIIILFSTIFAILNTNNKNIIKGIRVKNVDISSLSSEDAINKLTEVINKELIAEISLIYGKEYSVSLKPEQIEFKYDINNAIDKAYQIGRQGNVLKDNYTIIFSKLFGKEEGINYSYNGELLNQFIEDINSKIPGVVVEPTYYIEDNKLFVNKGKDGIKVKADDLKNEIINSIISRRADEMTDGFKQTIEIPIENVKASQIDMKKIHSEIYHEPVDAYYESEPYKIYPDIDGVDLAISIEEAEKLVKEESKEEYTFDLKITKAEKTLDDLGTEAFPYLISQFSTKYDASNRNRSTNLEIAAKKINGKVLMPGDEFSFNKIVGKRTVEEGYKDAAIYADGGVVDGLAGGICQISSTLYNSALLANLQIVERRNHSFTTSYSPAGRDATVVWGTTDF